MPGQGRSVESWNALAPSTRRRWIAAFGSQDAALEAYRNGLSLTKEQRGHGATPERPIQALLRPQEYPQYVAKHIGQLNEMARQRGLPEHGTGPRGETVTSYKKSGGDYTWVVGPDAVDRTWWRFSAVFRTLPEAQLYARRSWAPAGVVIIVDRGEQYLWRYEVWFLYPPGKASKRSPGRRKSSPRKMQNLNARRRRASYQGHERDKKPKK